MGSESQETTSGIPSARGGNKGFYFPNMSSFPLAWHLHSSDLLCLLPVHSLLKCHLIGEAFPDCSIESSFPASPRHHPGPFLPSMPYLVFLYFTYHHLTYYTPAYLLTYFLPALLGCKLYKNRNFVLFLARNVNGTFIENTVCKNII